MSLVTPSPLTESRLTKCVLVFLALSFVTIFLLVPLVVVFVEAFSKGWQTYSTALMHPDAMSALRLTLLTAVVVVPFNLVFGLTAAWAIAHFRFSGRRVLLTLIDLPLAVSPVISGMVFVLLYGAHGYLRWLIDLIDIKIIFAWPGIVLATTFVTVPFIARELITLMQEQGADDEEAAVSLGASGWQMFRLVTIPKVKWALFYGVILCNARAVGEFGAVSVVSGHIRGKTNTLPLHIEILYNEYQFTAAFAVSTLLASLALLSLVAKAIVEWKSKRGA